MKPRSAERWHFHSRAVLLLVMGVLPVTGMLLYAGSSSTRVFLHLVVDGLLLALWLAAAVGLGRLMQRVTKVGEGQSSGALQFSTAAAIGLGLQSLIVLGLGLVGWLNAVTVWSILGMGWLAAIYTFRTQEQVAPGSWLRWLKSQAGWEWLWLCTTPFVAMILIGAMMPPGLLWTPGEPHGYDVVEYHLQIPREWFEAGRIEPLEHNVFSYFPFNVEMHFLVAMYLWNDPWSAAYLAQLMHAVFMGLAVFAVYGFALPLRPPTTTSADRSTSSPGPILCALSVLTVPWLTQLAAIAYDEGGFLLFGTLAIGWSFRAVFDVVNRVRRFALAGAMAGFAAGSKLTAVPEVLVAIPVVSILAVVLGALFRRKQEGPSRLLLGIGTFCVAGTLCFSPWLLRNFAWAHNPVFPEMMPLLGKAHFSEDQVKRWEAAHKPPTAQQLVRARITALCDQVLLGARDWQPMQPIRAIEAWQFGFVLLPLGIVAFTLAIRRPPAWFLFGLLLILIVFWLGFTHLQARFFLLAVPISALLLAQINWRRVGMMSVGLLLTAFGATAWWNTNAVLLERLDESRELLAVDMKGLSLQAPKNVTLTLIGDARAFNYPGVPMSRLRYRTVFDVKNDRQDFPGAWTNGQTDSTWTLIDWVELRRLSATYKNLPGFPLERAGAAGGIVEWMIENAGPYIKK